MLIEGERDAIAEVIEAGERYGYGNMIAHLKTAWVKHLMDIGLSRESAILAADTKPFDEPNGH